MPCARRSAATAARLRKVRADDLAAHADPRADRAQSRRSTWRKSTRSISAAPTRPARTTATSRGWRCCSPGLPDSIPGHHRQPAVRLRPRCGRRGGARDPRRRDRLRHRRRRRVDDAGAVRHGQGDGGVPAHGRDLRHHHRLALRQSADEGAIRRRFDAGDRRERRRGIPGVAAQDQDAFALRSQQRAGKAMAAGYFAEEIVAGRGARRQGGADPWSTPTSIRGPTPRPSSSPS